MDTETIARRWFNEVWNERKMDLVDELLLPETVAHLETGDIVGIDQFKVVCQGLYQAFPDFRMEIESVLTNGNEAAVRWRGEGTPAPGALGLKPTEGKKQLRGMAWLRIRDGRIVEGWDSWNMSSLASENIAAEAHLRDQMQTQGIA